MPSRASTSAAAARPAKRRWSSLRMAASFSSKRPLARVRRRFGDQVPKPPEACCSCSSSHWRGRSSRAGARLNSWSRTSCMKPTV
ncbi:Uncharacterised protein [Bordetella pertussis]|nr:Uncharacterised protein [Bordetella pertussis]CFP65448.1 Uncharacterised protein [Bordetella pertussis]